MIKCPEDAEKVDVNIIFINDAKTYCKSSRIVGFHSCIIVHFTITSHTWTEMMVHKKDHSGESDVLQKQESMVYQSYLFFVQKFI